MKKEILYLSCIIVLSACGGAEPDVTHDTEIKAESPEITLTSLPNPKSEAIALLDSMNAMVEKGIKGEVSNKEVNNYIKPLMDKYQEILSTLPHEDSLEVHNYRVMGVNRMIELKMQNAN